MKRQRSTAGCCKLFAGLPKGQGLAHVGVGNGGRTVQVSDGTSHFYGPHVRPRREFHLGHSVVDQGSGRCADAGMAANIGVRHAGIERVWCAVALQLTVPLAALG